MLRLGYTLSSEEHDPRELIKFAVAAENAGFSFLSISDHFHPWVEKQGQSPFVWNVIGALSTVTKTVNVLIGVNCPIMRYHPAIIAQAAATSQVMLEGRFLLGVGTGENLNEHVIGKGWPPFDIRLEMLEESIKIMRLLWQGKMTTFFGKYYTIDSAKIYTKPQNSIPIIFSAYGPKAAKTGAKLGDGFITSGPNQKLVEQFEKNGGRGKPKFAQISVCFAQDRQKAKEIMLNYWPTSALPKPLNTELKLPGHFANTAKLISADEASKDVPIGKDREGILDSIKKYRDAGFDNLYIHNIGPNQLEFIEFARKEILPNFIETTIKKSGSEKSIKHEGSAKVGNQRNYQNPG